MAVDGHAKKPGRWLEELTWPEADAWFRRDAVMLVPIGAASKEHGHHLPLCTDYLLARGICDGVLEQLPVLSAPVVSFGYYPAFRHYPGSQHLSPETFTALLRDVINGFIAQGLRHILVVNTGISTEPLVNVLLRELYEETGVRVTATHISGLGRAMDDLMEQELGGHGDEHETSLIQAIAPDHIRTGKAQTDYGNVREEPDTVFYRPTVFNPSPESGIDFSHTGVRGDPTLATLEKGHASLAATVGDIVDGLRKIWPEALAAQQ